MASDNNIHGFTAKDIEKYHKGQLSPSQMHALEKAALDDPFLADAIEGYNTPGLNIQADIAELTSRLQEKQDKKGAVVSISGRSAAFPWFRIAAMIVVLAGAGLLSYQFLFKPANEEIALNKPQEQQQSDIKEEIVDRKDTTTPTVTSIEPSGETQGSVSNGAEKATPRTVTGSVNDGNISRNVQDVSPTVNAPTVKTEDSRNDEQAAPRKEVDNLAAQNRKVAEEQATSEKKEALARTTQAAKDNAARANEVTANNNEAVRQNSYNRTNFFRGQVTDANNNPLPFANIVNTTDNVGTYTDARGNFTLVSPADSVMNVQVRALGFENNRLQLRSDVPTNQIRLQEDRSITARVLDTVKRNYAIRSRDAALTFEEPEPADGWASYDSYLANNLSDIPEAYESKKALGSDAVELSFEVNKFGEPVNIRIEKSLCDKCDKEAIRLVKQGPKWKRKAKKGKRTTVTVPFTRAE